MADLQSSPSVFEKAKSAPDSPGVYLMKGDGGKILYVGKAKSLKKRVISYFGGAPKHTKTEVLMTHVLDLDLILTQTEAEALILECTLIKKHRPKYNIRLKDDKAYPLIKIQVSDAFPRLEWTRRVLQDGGRYFGPFPSAYSARQVLNLLTQTFKLRDCSDNSFQNRSRPCLLYQMGRCSAPCVGLISQELYRQSVEQATQVLEGRVSSLLKQLKSEMLEASHHEEFERAAELRDAIHNIQLITETQGVFDAESTQEGYSKDVISLAIESGSAHAVVLEVRSGKLMNLKHYQLQNLDAEQTQAEILYSVVSLHYLQEKPQEGSQIESIDDRSDRVAIVPFVPSEFQLLEQVLRLKIRMPAQKSEEQLLQVATSNARHALQSDQLSIVDQSVALEEIQTKLHLAKLPIRIECYDISNFQGTDAVGSRVVFIEGKADKSLYRRYKIKTVEGSNDFAMMKEVLSRRFANQEETFPDLVVVDGGVGQLQKAVLVLEELDIQGIDVVGLAKARVKADFKAPEIEATAERIFIPGRKNPLPLYPGTRSFNLLTQIRDEAHRFAIGYHRNLRRKRHLKEGPKMTRKMK